MSVRPRGRAGGPVVPASGRRRAAVLAALALLAPARPATVGAPAPERAATAAEVTDADDLLVVDCLLPPKVRRLGRRGTYLAPRTPIKATAVECRIRGGEYTEPDQANLGTALRVWLPQAETGDPEAQYYVGQIFEKGLGVAPDYPSAAQWYQKAAEQGYSAAQISLGSLYETGRGVPADPQEAIRWYRRAAGIAEDLVVLQGSEVEALRASEAELGERTGELEESRRETEGLRREVRELEKEKRDRGPAGPKRGEISFGRYFALVIGNADYRELADVATAAADAAAVAALLRDRYGFEVQVLRDATRLDIMRALNALREKLTRDDNLLVYYAGRARRDAGGATSYWQPVDAHPQNPSQWIPTQVVSEHLDLVPARHVLVVADALFSGLRSRSAVARLPQGMSEEERYYHIRLLREKRCRLVLAAGRPSPVAAAGARHSAFAQAFLDALGSGQGVVEASRVYRQLNERLDVTPAPEFAPMQWARNDVSEFFFVTRG